MNNSFLLHWNGTAWKQAATPSPSASNAWAVGSYQSSTGAGLTLILHWNGTA